jgi:hypothetical protein
MRARKASKPAAADTARELRGNAKLDQLSARKLPRQKCSLQVAVYDGRLRLGAVRPGKRAVEALDARRPQPCLLCQHRQCGKRRVARFRGRGNAMTGRCEPERRVFYLIRLAGRRANTNAHVRVLRAAPKHMWRVHHLRCIEAKQVDGQEERSSC